MTAKLYHAIEDDAVLVDAVDNERDCRREARSAALGSIIDLTDTGLEGYFFSGWRGELVDLLVIAAAVEFCDLTVRRPKYGWARAFDLKIAVYELGRWDDPVVARALAETLVFLTGDQWSITFVQRTSPRHSFRQGSLGLYPVDKIIMPYSDGIDSRAVWALTEDKEGAGLVRVRLGTKGAHRRSSDPRERRFATVPYKLKLEPGQRVESSARSRGFKFSIITGIAATLAQVKRIVVTESGQGALGPILVASGQTYPDYRVHPAFTRRIEFLFEALVGDAPAFEYPRIWSTKGETIREASELEQPARWDNTRSCWQSSQQVSFEGKRRQCGICAACMLRRMSMHAAGVEEAASEYIWEDLAASDFSSGAVPGFTLMTPALEKYAIAGVMHMDHLAALSGSSIHRRSIDRLARETAEALGFDRAETERRLHDLLARHRAEWLSFVESLGPSSFVAKLIQVSPWPQ
jgi:hypothetical protein